MAPLPRATSSRAPPVFECETRIALANGSKLVQPTCPPLTILPDTVEEARALEPVRLARVLKAWTPSLGKDWNDFGDWERDGTRTGLRKIMAGLKALETLPAEDPFRPAPEFPSLVEDWLKRNAVAFARPGTDTSRSPVRGSEGDYDFTMMQILTLIYHFKDRPEFLSNDAIWALLYNEHHAVRSGRGRRVHTRIPSVGNQPQGMMFEVVAEFPETENHVLMINTWAYLVNQWLEHDYRRDPRVSSYFARHPSRFRNEGSGLERMLLGILARPLHAGFFETNARPYGAYSLRALQLLYSYADGTTPGGRKIKIAAQNALDYAAVRFAFQSFQGKRFGPSRRNFRYRELLGVYDSDYVPYMFGVLTGAYAYDDSLTCRGQHCAYQNPQARGFALESVMSAYRVPDLVWDFMLHPDNHEPGHGAWVRAQARYTERHYLQGKWPRYPGRLPQLGAAIRQGTAKLEPAPEFYFITQDYMNSAGGRGEHYAGMDAWLPGALHSVNDLFAKPSTLILPGDVGYWRSFAEIEDSTLAFEGDAAHPYASNNTGVYKNLVYGYSTDDRAWPLALPNGWTATRARTVGELTLRVVDLSNANTVSNPRFGFFVVLGRFRRTAANAPLTGFWQVVPEAEFDNEADVWDCILGGNAPRNFPYAGPYELRLCPSGDSVTLNANFDAHHNAFLRINGSTRRLTTEHADLDKPYAMNAFPLLEAREVDATYRYTGRVYALARGDGRVTIDNPHLGERLLLDSSEPRRPNRRAMQRAPMAASPVVD